MKSYRILGLLFILLQVACSSYHNNGLDSLFLTKVYVNNIPAFPDLNHIIMNPQMVSFSDNYIAVYEPNMDSLILLKDRNSHKSTHIISKGQGPEDLVSVEDICYDKGVFHFLSFRQKKVLMFDEKSTSLSQDSLINNVLCNNTCSTVFARDSSLLFFYVLNCDERFMLVTSSSSYLFGTISPSDDFSSQDFGWILQGRFVLNKTNKKLFWGSGMGGVYGIFDYSDADSINSVIQNLYSLPETMGPGERTFTNHSVLGSASITSSDDYVFMLYSGQTMGTIINLMIKDDALFDSNTILVFDWDGNPIKQINTNHDLRCICFDNKDSKLYGIELNDDNEYSFCEIPF